MGRSGGGGYGGGGSGRLYTYRYTVSTRMIPALRWAATRAISMFHNIVSTKHKLFQEKGEPKRNRTEALLLTSLTLYQHLSHLTAGPNRLTSASDEDYHIYTTSFAYFGIVVKEGFAPAIVAP